MPVSESSEPKPGLALYTSLTSSLSRPRLEAYRIKGDSDVDLLARYNWNICLCEALYPTLQNLEVAFRNNLHHALTQEFGEYWMWNDPPLSRDADREQIDKAEANLLDNGKPAEPSRMVAELTFGFWTRLLDRRFERVLWPQLLRAVFPHVPAKVRRRDSISAHFEKVRRIRNRVSHHEPIWKLNLLDEHRNLREALSWLAPDLEELTRSYDRFPQVHSKAFLDQLKLSIQGQSLALHQKNLKLPTK